MRWISAYVIAAPIVTNANKDGRVAKNLTVEIMTKSATSSGWA